MKLELKKTPDGTQFAICVCSEKLGKQIVIPLSFELSEAVDRMCREEGVGASKLILPRSHPALDSRRH